MSKKRQVPNLCCNLVSNDVNLNKARVLSALVKISAHVNIVQEFKKESSTGSLEMERRRGLKLQ